MKHFFLCNKCTDSIRGMIVAIGIDINELTLKETKASIGLIIGSMNAFLCPLCVRGARLKMKKGPIDDLMITTVIEQLKAVPLPGESQ